MQCKNILIYEFHDSNAANSDQEIRDNAQALRLKYERLGRRVVVRPFDALQILSDFPLRLEQSRLGVELQNMQQTLGVYLLTHGGASTMTPSPETLARFVFYVIVRSGAPLDKIVVGGCKAAGGDYSKGSFDDSSLRRFGSGLLKLSKTERFRLPNNLMASAYNLWLTTYYAQSSFIIARNAPLDPALATSLQVRPIRTVETKFNPALYKEAHRPSAALINAALPPSSSTTNAWTKARTLADAMTALREEARNQVFVQSGNAMLRNAQGSPFRDPPAAFESYADLESTDRVWAAKFLEARAARIATVMSQLFDARYQDGRQLRREVIEYIQRKLIIKVVHGSVLSQDTVAMGTLSEYTDNQALAPILSLVEDSLGSNAPAIRFVV